MNERLWDYLLDDEKESFELAQMKIKYARSEGDLILSETVIKSLVKKAYDRFKSQEDYKEEASKMKEKLYKDLEEIKNKIFSPIIELHRLKDQDFEVLKDKSINAVEMDRYLQQLMSESSSDHEQILNEITKYVFDKAK
ncbi:hypothetical protein [Metabacillus schmidteae]|uniref:hypothetical protein n=1 Tax=Metabacillus schmidteae TaxID=2730405 RepID=UPI00158AFB0D|nr:hypothetical protein [Metabacillus schmidteae]